MSAPPRDWPFDTRTGAQVLGALRLAALDGGESAGRMALALSLREEALLDRGLLARPEAPADAARSAVAAHFGARDPAKALLSDGLVDALGWWIAGDDVAAGWFPLELWDLAARHACVDQEVATGGVLALERFLCARFILDPAEGAQGCTPCGAWTLIAADALLPDGTIRNARSPAAAQALAGIAERMCGLRPEDPSPGEQLAVAERFAQAGVAVPDWLRARVPVLGTARYDGIAPPPNGFPVWSAGYLRHEGPTHVR